VTTAAQDRRATILDAAAELFARRGFAAVGIDEIGAAVGVSGPAIYRYFPSKDRLFEAVVETTLVNIDDGLAATLGDQASPSEVVLALVESGVSQACGLSTLFREPDRLVGESASGINDVHGRVEARLAAAVRAQHPEIDPLSLAIRVRALISPLTSVAARRTTLSSGRQLQMLQDAAVAVLNAPVVRGPELPPAERWSPTLSRRSDILRVSLTLFRKRGYHGVGVQEIAEAAGISAATVYHYYESKSDILVDAYERADHRVVAGALDALDEATSASDALERLVASFTRIAIDSVDLTIVTSREVGVLPDDDRPRRTKGLLFTVDAWLTAMRELYGELPDVELHLLIHSSMVLIRQAAQVAEHHPDRRAEISALALAHACSLSLDGPSHA
jgi:AcrR family transcriptional regulator